MIADGVSAIGSGIANAWRDDDGNTNDPLADAGDTIVFNGASFDQEVDLSPELHIADDVEPMYVCLEADEQKPVFGFGSFESGGTSELLLKQMREAVSDLVVRNTMQSRIRELRPTVQVVNDCDEVERCDMYAQIAVTNVSYSASTNSSDGSGGSSKHFGSSRSTSNAEHLDVMVRVRFLDHATDQIIAIGHGRARLEAKSSSNDVQGRSDQYAGSGSASSQRSSILTAAITQRLIGKATSAAIIDVLQEVDEFSEYQAAQYASSTDTP